MVLFLNNTYLSKRFALAEAKGVYEQLKNEDEKKIVEIARNLNWNITRVKENSHTGFYDFSINFPLSLYLLIDL